MVRVEMLAVGKELLIGRTLNTNAHWVGARLSKMGTMLKEITTVDDELAEISAGFGAALGRSPDFLVVVGGLGPTPDDMTLKGIAEGMGVKLVHSPAALELILEHYALRGLDRVELTPARMKMAMLPAGAEPLPNEVGTAPGVRIVLSPTVVYSLPGVPTEMRGIFRKRVEPEIRRVLGRLHRKVVKMKLEGVLESSLAPVIDRELKEHPGAYIKSHPRGVREGVSRIELDVAVVGTEREPVEREGEEIGRSMAREVEGLGGVVKSAKGISTGKGVR
jgi:molybdopterin-biosynthesis enzyme MoeA-like protein